MIYIYALICPLSGTPRYIGKCSDPRNRLRVHIFKAKGQETKHHCANWIRSLLSQGLQPTIQVLRELDDGADWQLVETELIAEYRLRGFDLTNGTSGGDGFPNLSREVILKRVQTRRERLESSPEHKARVLASIAASHSRPDARENHRNGAKSAWADPVKREKMLASMRTPEALARRAEATRKRNANPEFAAKHRETMKRMSAEPDARERMKRARDIRWGKSG